MRKKTPTLIFNQNRSSFFVEFVFITFPQAHVTVVSTYSGCNPSFILYSPLLIDKINILRAILSQTNLFFKYFTSLFVNFVFLPFVHSYIEQKK